jgi:DNA-binding IclR family transcriptional regulator
VTGIRAGRPQAKSSPEDPGRSRGADAVSASRVASVGSSMAAAKRSAPRSGGLKVRDKTLRVLDLFVAERPEWSATEIARELDLPIATAHRILRSLESHTFLMRSGNNYRLGLAAVDLGRRAVASMDLRWALRPTLQRLARETGETVLLSVHDEARHGALCVDRIEASHPVRLSIDIGRVTPLHAGAASKALLAFLDRDEIEYVLRGPLPRLAPGTIVDRRRLRAELERIREHGYAVGRRTTRAPGGRALRSSPPAAAWWRR